MEIIKIYPRTKFFGYFVSVILLFVGIVFLFLPYLQPSISYSDASVFSEVNGIVYSIENNEGNLGIRLENDNNIYRVIGSGKDILNYEELKTKLPQSSDVVLIIAHIDANEYFIMGISSKETVILDVEDIVRIQKNNEIFIRYGIVYTPSFICIFIAITFFVFTFFNNKSSKDLKYFLSDNAIYYDEKTKKHYQLLRKKCKRMQIFSLFIPIFLIFFFYLTILFFAYLTTKLFIILLIIYTIFLVLALLGICFLNMLYFRKKAIDYFSSIYFFKTDQIEIKNYFFRNFLSGLQYEFTSEGFKLISDISNISKFSHVKKYISFCDLSFKGQILFRSNKQLITIMIEAKHLHDENETKNNLLFYLNEELYQCLKKYQIKVTGLEDAMKNLKKLMFDNITFKFQLETLFGFGY